ncbi:hypothetical protein K4L05_02270 [Phaeobacter inhibens]|uniref:hypothetical protein n=1 Tax=Phaeobacter inhibens TaxID=221822 RepID=UPI0021A261EB|nr:hypothetical protein [Phaeobacter inhibens]UWR84922.1 hypothetical protein K4L05_02270 [Phaeobacter inhibens]
MVKSKEPRKIQQGETENIHPQISRSSYSDLMSEQTVVTITVPPLGNPADGFYEALENDAFAGGRKLNSWADIQALVGFEDLEAAEGLHPTHQGHHGPVQFPEVFSDEAFKRGAYQALKLALEALEGLSDEHKEIILNSAAPRFVGAGMALAEARIRHEHYDDVAVRRRVRTGLQKWSAAELEKKSTEIEAVLEAIAKYRNRGFNISTAARLAFQKDRKGASPEANRRLYYRRRGKKDL